MIVATFQALLPEPGQERTIQHVELSGNIMGIFTDQGLPGNRGNLTVECLYLHYYYIVHHGPPDLGPIKELFQKLPAGIAVRRTVLRCFPNKTLSPEERDAVFKAASNVNIEKENVVFESFKDPLNHDEDCKCHATFVAPLCACRMMGVEVKLYRTVVQKASV